MHRYLENNAPKNHSAGIISSNLSRDYDYPKDESGGEVNNNGYGGSDGKSLGTDRRTQTGGNFGSGLEGKEGGNGASAGDEHNSMESAASVGDKGAAYALRGFENSGREDGGNLANLANLGNKASSAAASIGESMGLGGYNGQESGSIDSKSGFGNDGDQRGFGANRGEGEGFKGGMNRSGEGNTGAMDIGKQADEAQKNNQDAFGLGANTEKDMQGSGKGTNDGDFLREEASGQGIGEIGADQRSGLAESFGGDLGAINGGLGAGLEGKPLAEKNVMTGNMGEGAVGQAGLAAGLGNGPAGGGFGELATGSRSGQAGGLRRKGAKPEKKLGESAAENAKLAAEAGEKEGEKNRENSAKPFGPFTGDAKNFGGTPSLADGFGNGAGSGYNVNKGEGLTGGAGDGSGRGNGGAGGPYSKSKPGSGYGGYGGGPGEFGPNLQGGGFPRSGGIKQGGKGDDPVGQKGIQNALDDEDNDPSAQKALQNLENGSGTPEQAKEKAPSKKKLPPKLKNLLKKLNDAFNNPKPKPKKSEEETPSTPQKKWPTFPFKEEKSPIDALQEAEEELENEIKEQNIQPDEQEMEEELAKEKEEELAKEEEKAQENAIKNTETPEGRAENSNNPLGAAANAETPEGAEENTKTPEGRAANANTPEGAAANAQTPDGQKANTQTPEGRAANSSTPGGATENSKFPEGQQANLSTPEGVEANSHTPGGAEANTQTPEGRKANTKTPEGRAANATTPEGAAANAETADGQKENAQTPEGRKANEKTPGGRAANEKMPERRDADKSEMAKAPQEKEELKDLMDDAKAEKALNDEIADKIGDEAEANALENGAPAEEAKKIGDEEAEKARKDFDKNLDDKLKDKIAGDANKNKFTDPEAEKAIKGFLKGKKKREEAMPQSEDEEENLAKDLGKGAKQDAGDENLSDQFAEPEENMEEMSDDEEEPEKYMEGLGESEEQGEDGADAGEQKAEKQAAVLKAMKNGKNTIDAQLEGIKSDLKNEALKPLEKKQKEEDQIEDDIVGKLPPNTENLPISNGFTKLPLKNKKIPKPVSEDDKEKNRKNQKLKNLLGNAITKNQHKDSPLDSIITDDGVYNLPDNAENLEIDSGFIFYPEKEGEELKKDDKCKEKLNSFKNMGEFPDYPLGAVLYILKFFKKKIDLRKNNSSNSDECFKPEKGIGLQINKGNVKLEPWDSFSKKIRPSVLEEDVPKEKEILPKKEKPKIKSKVFKTLNGKKYLEVTPPLGPSHTIELNDDGEIKFDKDDFKEIMDAENDVNLNILKTNKPLEKDSPKENAFEENTMSKIKKRKKDPLKLISPRNSFNSKFNPRKLFAAKKKPDIKRVYIKVVKNPQNQIKFTKIFVKNPKNKKSSVKIIGAQESPKIQLEPTKLVKPVEQKEPPKIVRKIRKPLPQISKTVIKQPIVDVSPKENYIIKSEGEKKIRKPTTQMSKTVTKQPIVKVLPKENYIMKRRVLKRKNKPIRIINPQKNKIDNPQPKEKEKEKEKQEINPSKVINN